MTAGSRARMALVVGLALVGLAGCGAGGTAIAPPTPAPGAASAGSAPTPPAVTKDQRFGFDDIAQFPDGVEVEMSEAVASKAEQTQQGAESTDGEMVTVSIRIGNYSEVAYETSKVRVSATYGEGKPAPVVLDSVGELQSGFSGSVAPSDETVAPFGFAIPFDQLGKVTFLVDPGDGKHEAVSFTGAVQRP